ncbi:hypothetical protein H8K32_00410 [Undibacterium jejuense]|uniref:Uncharacterized protein n=1 Tax=Undibacterium jejuense TaxID=1344949 RepID=A0A923KMV6_9BURK|nr:hypothetical protein [Undibacterium jejuense]MBC3860549.1 hypothetical protein [Undibacterium jejuense]
MLWIAGSLFFCWMMVRECLSTLITPTGYDHPISSKISIPFLILYGTLALAFAWQPFQYWRFERLLSIKATEIADFHPAKVHCNTIFDTFVDQNYFAAGHADPHTGKIVFQYPWCNRLMDYLHHPQKANREEIVSLNIFTHESMHVRGEYNEAKTECEAVQRNYRAAKLLGVPDQTAKKTALNYYLGEYQRRGAIGGLAGSYFSAECAPGKAMDEHLSDSTWAR